MRTTSSGHRETPQADYDAWHDHIGINGFGLDRGNGLRFQPQPAGPRPTSCRPNRHGSPLGTSVEAV